MKLNRTQLRRIILNEVFGEKYDQNVIDEVMSPYENLTIDSIFSLPASKDIFKGYEEDIKKVLKEPEFYPNRIYKPVPAAGPKDPNKSTKEHEPGVGIVISFNFSALLDDVLKEKLSDFLQILAMNLNNKNYRRQLLGGVDDPKFARAEAFKGKGSILIYLYHL